MAATVTNTNYNGTILDDIYLTTGVGNQTVQKGLIHSIFDESKFTNLAKMVTTDDPFRTYDPNVPSDTATTTYSENRISKGDMNLFETFNPKTFRDLWPIFKSQGTMTNLMLNPRIRRAMLDLYMNSAGRQLSKLYWQGDTAGAAGLNLFDGLLKLMNADADVVDVANQGVPSATNIVDILEAMYSSIPDKYLDDERYKIICSTSTWRIIQLFNNDVKKAFTGILDENVMRNFLEKQIIHIAGLPANTLVGALATSNMDSNLHAGYWVSPDDEFEAARIRRKEDGSDNWYVRINATAGVQYREGSEIILYQGS